MPYTGKLVPRYESLVLIHESLVPKHESLVPKHARLLQMDFTVYKVKPMGVQVVRGS